jgi:hypothetical protein
VGTRRGECGGVRVVLFVSVLSFIYLVVLAKFIFVVAVDLF